MSQYERLTKDPQGGFALIIVLWTVAVLVLLASHIETSGREELELTLNLRRAACLQAQADGAVAVAAFHLLHGSEEWQFDGRPYPIAIANDGMTQKVVVRLLDERGMIDLNAAPPPLLIALLTTLGAGSAQAASVAANLSAWRFPAGSGPAGNAAYRAAGRELGPPGAPFETVQEIQDVLGMTPHLAALLEPHLTVWSETGTDPAFADPVVKGVLAKAAAVLPLSPSQHSQATRVVNIDATAYGADGSMFTREAIVKIQMRPREWMRILVWSTPQD